MVKIYIMQAMNYYIGECQDIIDLAEWYVDANYDSQSETIEIKNEKVFIYNGLDIVAEYEFIPMTKEIEDEEV